MTAAVPRSLLRWFGRPDSPLAAGDDRGAAVHANAQPGALEDTARHELLGAISDFLLDNRLAVTDANLQIARAVCSGANRSLGRKIAAQRLAGPISQAWLDEAVAGDVPGVSAKEDYEQLIIRLRAGLEVFTTVTTSARSAHGLFQTELEKQVGRMEAADAMGLAVTSLADIAKAMLERTCRVEEEMRRSESEASALRKSLERAQRDANIDHLTGLPNRRGFEGALQREYREAQAAIEPLSVAFCDIDHFKQVNDTHGHEVGDRVIQAIAQVLARISNEKCHVARHGGEEFVVLFRGTSCIEAKARLDQAREQMAGRNFVNRKTDEPIGGITFSGGVADVFGYPDCRGALEAADQALYRAKQEGRNRVEIA